MFDDADDATVTLPTFGPGAFFADRFRIDALLGSGAMGRVYAVTELRTGRQMALKVLHKERLGEADTVHRFRREAEVLASLGHPCIVEIYAFHHTSDGTPYLAMELLEGVTLKTRLANAGRFEDPRDFQVVLDAICSALSAAHACGIVHRDMKPDNVFLPATGEPRAKLVDFGLSRMAATNKDITHSGMLLGTPRYMAPEQLRDAGTAGPAVDIYSMGILAFESLAGRSPYPADDYGQLLGCLLEGRVLPLEQLRPGLPPALGDVIRRAMHPDAAARFATCDELAEAYAAAVGSPSRRAFQPTSTDASRRDSGRISSGASVVSSKGSTLAFDASAVEGLPDPYELGSMLGSYEGLSMPASAASSSGVARDALPLPSGRALSPTPPAEASFVRRGAPSGAAGYSSAPPPEQSGVGRSPAPFPPSSPSRFPPAAFPPVARPASGFPPSAPGVASTSPIPATVPLPTPPARKRRGLLVFVVALLAVIALSAVCGFALRTYLRSQASATTASSPR